MRKFSHHGRITCSIEPKHIITRFILGWAYGVYFPISPSDEKFLPCCLLILIKCPDTLKCTPAKKNLKIELCTLLKLSSHHKHCTECKVGNSPKLGPKAMKRALESSFNLKIKSESNHLVDMLRMIEPLSSLLSPASNSRRHFKRS